MSRIELIPATRFTRKAVHAYRSAEKEGAWLAHLAETSFYRDVRVKDYDSLWGRTLVAATKAPGLGLGRFFNQIRGLKRHSG